ncbi:minichromosome maintenance protein MCM [Halogeometricum borinquense]|uniref:Minichromosome maintenance protein MCM n=1 Tax=Halogeometricum borinquense TaxID=60847 RepID=A0A482T085_9EURY|nr:sigma 54-interacting transcriptional regulator [Halogeometricum borinquense]RYJ08286.1 minichromosome maintenance protein MCM [Halogeometricum borinquense]
MAAESDTPREIAVGDEIADDVMDVVQLRGQVTKRSSVRPKVEKAVWRCLRCGIPQPPISQGLGRLVEPAQSICCERKTANYRLDRDESEWVDWMKVRLQEPPDDLSTGAAESTDLYLLEDLARMDIESGQRVTVTATYKPMPDKGRTVWRKAFEVLDIEVEDDSTTTPEDGAHEEALSQLRSMDDPIPMLAEACVPHHQGDDHLKEALLLQLVGGADVEGEAGKTYRGTMHVALIGDPGTGKSNFGEAIRRLSPRGAKASGNDGTSAAGLTAAITQDGFSDAEYTITAGAVPKASGGVLFVDELDSAGTSEQHALLEAMEDGKITVEKGGQNATLKADTAIWAAANPDDGHFHGDDPAIAQSSMYSPLLTRFDLIFCPRERTDEESIEAVGAHVLDSWDVAARQDADVDVDDDLLEDVEADVAEATLRQYVAEAQSYTPTFANDEVKRALRVWYVDTKTSLISQDREGERALPVTPRSLHDIVRLASASARARHSDTIEMRDAARATRLKTQMFRSCGLDPGEDVVVETDENGEAVISTATPTAAILEAVEELKFGAEYGAPREEVVAKVVEDADVSADEADSTIEDMLTAETLDEIGDGRLTA